MKVLLALVLLVLTMSNVYAQPKGVDFDNAVTLSEANYEDNYERLCKMPDVPDGYLYYFRPTTIGVKHSHDKVLELLLTNNLRFDKPDLNRDYLGDDIKGITDYENISFYTGLDKAEINRVWLIEDGPWGINWTISGGLVAVVIKPFSEGEVERQQQVELARQRQEEPEWQKQEELERQRQVELELQRREQDERLNNAGRSTFGSQGVNESDADRYDTGGGLGDGISFGGLGSRRAVGSLPKPKMSGCDLTQKIEVQIEIQVDREGSVVSAIVTNATYQDNCIWTMVLDAAKRSRFSPDQNASYRQTGWIKYIIVP